MTDLWLSLVVFVKRVVFSSIVETKFGTLLCKGICDGDNCHLTFERVGKLL